MGCVPPRFLRDCGCPIAAQLFGGAGVEYQRGNGTKNETFAKSRRKRGGNAAHNERAIFRTPLTVEEVLAAPHIYGVLTRTQCCPPTCGAAAAVICSEAFARRHQLDTSVIIAGQAMTTDGPSTFEEKSMIKVVGYDMSRQQPGRSTKRQALAR